LHYLAGAAKRPERALGAQSAGREVRVEREEGADKWASGGQFEPPARPNQSRAHPVLAPPAAAAAAAPTTTTTEPLAQSGAPNRSRQRLKLLARSGWTQFVSECAWICNFRLGRLAASPHSRLDARADRRAARSIFAAQSRAEFVAVWPTRLALPAGQPASQPAEQWASCDCAHLAIAHRALISHCRWCRCRHWPSSISRARSAATLTWHGRPLAAHRRAKWLPPAKRAPHSLAGRPFPALEGAFRWGGPVGWRSQTLASVFQFLLLPFAKNKASPEELRPAQLTRQSAAARLEAADWRQLGGAQLAAPWPQPEVGPSQAGFLPISGRLQGPRGKTGGRPRAARLGSPLGPRDGGGTLSLASLAQTACPEFEIPARSRGAQTERVCISIQCAANCFEAAALLGWRPLKALPARRAASLTWPT